MKTIIPFGSSETDALVMRWLATQKITPDMVMGYKIGRDAGGTSTIELQMWFDDTKKED